MTLSGVEWLRAPSRGAGVRGHRKDAVAQELIGSDQYCWRDASSILRVSSASNCMRPTQGPTGSAGPSVAAPASAALSSSAVWR